MPAIRPFIRPCKYVTASRNTSKGSASICAWGPGTQHFRGLAEQGFGLEFKVIIVPDGDPENSRDGEIRFVQIKIRANRSGCIIEKISGLTDEESGLTIPRGEKRRVYLVSVHALLDRVPGRRGQGPRDYIEKVNLKDTLVTVDPENYKLRDPLYKWPDDPFKDFQSAQP